MPFSCDAEADFPPQLLFQRFCLGMTMTALAQDVRV